MVKSTMLLRRRPSTTHEELVEHHRGTHAPLLTSVPAVQDHVRRSVQQHALDVALPGRPEPTFDGVADLWFDDVPGIGQVFAAPEHLAVIRPDGTRVCDMAGCEPLVTAEHVVGR